MADDNFLIYHSGEVKTIILVALELLHPFIPQKLLIIACSLYCERLDFPDSCGFKLPRLHVENFGGQISLLDDHMPPIERSLLKGQYDLINLLLCPMLAEWHL